MIKDRYQNIIIGGGHAGIEAALASAKIGIDTLMIVGNIQKIANMPCNPSIGGPAKGIIVREIDALGGMMGKATDATLLQLKMLNYSKGPAVRALRAQADKDTYPKYMIDLALNTKNLDVYESYVAKVNVEGGKVKGVETEDGKTIYSDAIVVTTGTYLASLVMCGSSAKEEGPDGQRPSKNLSVSFKELGLDLIRLKTGTPPRVKKDSVNYDILEKQFGDEVLRKFSEETSQIRPLNEQCTVYLTYTNEETHKIIRDNLHLSSMYSGLVSGVGPRYCPSIEDKVVRFSEKDRHQIFIEPEGEARDEVYIQGFSTSLPHEIQELMIHTIKGLEDCVITKYAYAIEYDAINPLELKSNLETKKIEGLFFAGQVNGTSGYEEAAGQGLIAGINSALKVQGKDPLVLRRDEAYIGVLIDDLITKGVKDPYRMLTSRAEFRLLLRHDNAEERLLHHGHDVGLVSDERYDKFLSEIKEIEKETETLKGLYITSEAKVNSYLEENGKDRVNVKTNLFDFLKRPEIDFSDLEALGLYTSSLNDSLKERMLINIKYDGYIQKEYKMAEKLKVMESRKIPSDIDYDLIKNLASEARDKLKKVKPDSIAQASRISGVNPSDISILLIYLESKKNDKF